VFKSKPVKSYFYDFDWFFGKRWRMDEGFDFVLI